MSISDNTQNGQIITLKNRSQLSITGVEDVQSFDDKNIILKSSYGMVAIDGESLHIDELSTDTGVLLVEGQIGGVFFFEPDQPKKKRGLLR